MKKIRNVWIFLIIALFPMMVNAASCDDADYKCIICEYDYEGYFSYSYTYMIRANGLGIATLQLVDENGQKYSNTISSQLKEGDFYTKDKDNLVCPTIEAITKVNDSNDKIEVTLLKKSNQSTETIEPIIIDENDKEFVDPNRETSNFTCDIYSKDSRIPMIHASYINGNVTYSIDSSRYTVDNTLIKDQERDIFSKGCNQKIYVHCDTDSDTCILSLTNPGNTFSTAAGMDTTSDEEEREEKYNQAKDSDNSGYKPDPLCANNACDISLKGICEEPTVARTLQFIGFLLFILKILVPAIIIIMGIVNLVKIVTSGKTDDATKYIKNIVLRIVVGVSVFMIPSFVLFIYQIANDVIGSNQENNFDNCMNCIFDTNNCQIKK